MPTYTYRNKATDEIVDLTMSISEMVDFEDNNPEFERQYEQMNIVDPVNVGITKPPVDFMKGVLGKVKEMPGADKSKIEKRWHIPKEV